MIRRLTDIKHISKLVEYGRKWHKRSELSHIPFSAKRSAQTVRGAMLSPGCAVFAAYDRDQLCGVLVGALVDYPWFEASFATDLVFIADRYGDRLFAEFVKWANKHTSYIQMGVTSGLGTADKFYTGIGMKKIGGIYFGGAE